MATTPENAMTPTSKKPERGGTSAWIWLLVLVLFVGATYAGYMAIDKHAEVFDKELERQALARDKGQLEERIGALRKAAEDAEAAKAEAETALKQARADAETANKQISDLQGEITALKDKIKGLEGEADAADKRAGEAAKRADDAVQAKESSPPRWRISRAA
jgi:uncharacterized protein HemX